MTDDVEKMQRAADTYQDAGHQSPYFNKNKPSICSLKEADIPYDYIVSNDINSCCCKEALECAPEHNMIYSGFGGQIIKRPIFQTGKTFIHVHSGILPQYRGSTTVYYSLLQENFCGASAIIMTPELDGGDVVAEERFAMPPSGIDIDYIYDPYIRAKVLVKAVQQYLAVGSFMGRPQGTENARTYFIAHPVLRHIVKLTQEAEGILP